MQHMVGAERAILPAVPAAGVPARERRRRADVGREMATPLAATFLGLLLVHNLLPAYAAGPDGGGDGDRVPEPTGGSDPEPGMAGIAAPIAAAAGPGAHAASGTTGVPVEVAALTGPDGLDGLRIAAGGVTPAQLAGGVAGATAATPASAGGLAAAGAAELALPDLGSAAGDAGAVEEEVGPIGRFVRGDGSDGTVVLTDGDDTFVGSDGDEHVIGGAGDDLLDGAGGDDQLEGGAGDDTLLGGSGDDLLLGGSGDDLLDGGLDDDTLLGGTGDDTLQGGGGDDFLNGGAGIDRLQGGTGNEILVLADIRDALTELGLGVDGGGNDTVVVTDSYAASLQAALAGTAGRATFVLGRPDVAHFPGDVAGYRQQIDPDIENIRLEGGRAHDVVGDDGDSLIIGNDGANRIHAGGGDDSVLGGGAADWIDGGDGDDWLDGGSGADTLYGGAGDDVFVFGLHEDGDMIFDHEGRNTLRIAGADPAKVVAGLQGEDLVVRYDGAVVATVDGYAGNAEHYAGIDLGDGARPIADFMPQSGAAAASAATAAQDWLADYVPEPAGLAEPLPEPWAGLDEPADLAPDLAVGDGGALPGMADGVATLEFQPSFALGADPLAMAELWLPVDDMVALPADAPLPERLAEERPAA